MKKDAAAIILCAGKGTRMHDDSKNKVTFDCAGTSVIRRIVDNMREGGVSRFVIVIGHRAESVMDALDGEEGVIYAYQKEQKGTGHASLIGLRALRTVGYEGSVIISMGDKIIAPRVIRGLLERAEEKPAVWGVQPLTANPNGGRVILHDGKPCGVVEFADAALEALADVSKDDYADALKKLGLNAKKAEKVIKEALGEKPKGYKTLCGRRFGAEELLYTPYANAGLYCFDAARAEAVVSTLGADNAQGEVYLTDALEVFSGEGEATLYEVACKEDMLTYSTKEELRELSRHFLRKASEIKEDILKGKLDGYFENLYRNGAESGKRRYLKLLGHFMTVYGDQKVIITRSPGRINLMGRHIDHRGGSINVMATDKDTVFVVSARQDGEVHLTNTDPAYPDRVFCVGEELERAPHEVWLDYLEHENVKKALEETRGDWSNYVKGIFLRTQLESDFTLCGMNMAADGCVPAAAGLSSSSSLVVAALEAVNALNGLDLSDEAFIRLSGEGEWFVGSRGGAGDHAAMKCSGRDRITHLGFKPFRVGEKAAFDSRYAVIVANSMIKARKSEGSKDTFNAKVAAYEFAFMLLRKAFPTYPWKEFRDLADITPRCDLYRMLKALPEKAGRDMIRGLLPDEKAAVERIFENHRDPGYYDLRGVALFGISECVRAERFMTLLAEKRYEEIGSMMKISHDGDRVGSAEITDDYLERCAKEETDPALVSGAYGCSAPEIDRLSDLLNSADGVLGSELIGAGLGGCVIALVEKAKAADVIARLNEKYYDANGYPHAADVFSASAGSSVLF